MLSVLYPNARQKGCTTHRVSFSLQYLAALKFDIKTISVRVKYPGFVDPLLSSTEPCKWIPQQPIVTYRTYHSAKKKKHRILIKRFWKIDFQQSTDGDLKTKNLDSQVECTSWKTWGKRFLARPSKSVVSHLIPHPSCRYSTFSRPPLLSNFNLKKIFWSFIT